VSEQTSPHESPGRFDGDEGGSGGSRVLRVPEARPQPQPRPQPQRDREQVSDFRGPRLSARPELPPRPKPQERERTPLENAVWAAAFGAIIADAQIHCRRLGYDGEYAAAKRAADYAVWILRTEGKQTCGVAP